ncbi:MAG: hypothetical protein OHK0048_14000 [Rhodoferax sp.]
MKPLDPIALTQALGDTAADRRLEVLRQVGLTGSISQAARGVGISYKAAWQAVDTLSNLSGVTLVERTVGGTGGGGARLTEHGQALLALADALAQARTAVLTRFAQAPAAARLAPALGLRTSLRNALTAQVLWLQTDTQTVRVGLGLGWPESDVRRVADAIGQADPREASAGAAGDWARASAATATHANADLVAAITAESTELLGLQPGLPLLALCKATAVTLTAPDFAPLAACHALDGTLVRVHPGAGRPQAVLQCPGGQQLVGFADPTLPLAQGQPARAHIAESAVVLALP